MHDPGRIVTLTVTDLAAESGTSLASVVRFCQDIDLGGFGDLKLRLAAETTSTPDTHTPPPGSPAGIFADVLRASADALNAAAASVDTSTFATAIDVIVHARHILVAGVGTSAPLAQDCAYRLRSIGLLAEAPADVHVQHVSAAFLRSDAALLAISHTGQTRETLAAATAAREAGATTIAVTSFHRSPLTELCDHSLVAGSSETQHQIEARASRLVHSALLDAIHTAITHQRVDLADPTADLAARIVAEHRL